MKDFFNWIPSGGGLADKHQYEVRFWHECIIAVKDWLSVEDKVVMDLGAGNMHLRKMLPEGVKYIPVDYRKTSPETIVCDFNKYQFPDLKVDCINVLGVVEYIKDWHWFFDRVTESCNKLMWSFKNPARSVDEMVDYLKSRGFVITSRHMRRYLGNGILACFERLTSKKLCKQIACTGCGACANACPNDAIEMKFDDAGFLKPQVNNKCINCGRCIKTCPAAKPKQVANFSISLDGKISTNLPLACHAVWADDETRLQSSSGGMFSVIAKYVLERGGKVFGAVWTEDFFCNIKSAATVEEILPMRCSKYVQSNTQKTFREVKDLLAKNILVAYFGLPCQIAGLKSYLQNKTDNLIAVDLVCAYAPSNIHFKKYLDEEFGLDKVKKVAPPPPRFIQKVQTILISELFRKVCYAMKLVSTANIMSFRVKVILLLAILRAYLKIGMTAREQTLS